MKRNKLYAANRWNQPVFLPNRFDGGGDIAAWDRLASSEYGAKYGDAGFTLDDYMNSTNFLGISKKDNPFSKGNLGSTMSGVFSGIAPAVGSMANSAISGGLSSGAGSAISNIGSTVGAALGMVNPVLGAAVGLGSQIVGGVTNALWGTKVDQAKLDSANQGTSMLNNFNSSASSFDDVQGPQAVEAVGDAYSGGLFKKGWARRKNQALREDRKDAIAQAERSVENNIDNLTDDQMNNLLSGWYALGGDLQTHGGDWTTGLTHIDAGLSHEENKYEGVQLGVDNEGTPNLVEEGETVYNDYVFSNRILADEATKQMFKLPKKKDVSFADISKKLEKEIQERPNDPISKAGFNAQMQVLEEQQERQKQEMEAERAKAAFEALSPEEQTALMQQVEQQEEMAQQVAEEQAMAKQQAMQQPSPEEVAMIQQPQMADGSDATLGQEPQINAFGGKLNKYPDGGGLDSIAKAIFKKLNLPTMRDYFAWQEANGINNDLFKNANGKGIEAWRKVFSDEAFRKAVNDAAFIDALDRGYDFGEYKPSATSGFRYDWDNFWEPVNEYSKKKGNTKGKYKIDKDYKGSIKDLENSKAYQDFTNYILNDASDEERQKYFRWIDDNTGRERVYTNNKGELLDGWQDRFKSARTDGLYGIQHYTPNVLLSNRNNQISNFVINEDGTVEPIIGDVPTDWTSAGNYAWSDEGNDYAYNYYKRPIVATPSPQPPAEEETSKGTKNKGVIPDLRKETSFGLLGPAIGLGLMGLGVGKPDTSSYDTAVSGAGDYTTADWMPRGDFLTYRPTDPWRWTNPILANSRAIDRTLVNNSGGNRGTAMAGLLANGYNTTIGLGEAGLKGEDANFDRRLKTATHNADVYKSNQGEYGVTSRFNASAYNDANRASTQMKLHAASAKDDANRWWSSNFYGNINSLFDNINQWEKWKRDHNTIANMYANGLAGVVSEDTPVAKGYVKAASEGGKLKRKKRGLTI